MIVCWLTDHVIYILAVSFPVPNHIWVRCQVIGSDAPLSLLLQLHLTTSWGLTFIIVRCSIWRIIRKWSSCTVSGLNLSLIRDCLQSVLARWHQGADGASTMHYWQFLLEFFGWALQLSQPLILNLFDQIYAYGFSCANAVSHLIIILERISDSIVSNIVADWASVVLWAALYRDGIVRERRPRLIVIVEIVRESRVILNYRSIKL